MGCNRVLRVLSPSFKLIFLALFTFIEKRNGFHITQKKSAYPVGLKTRCFSSANDADLMADLRSRVKEVEDSASKLPFVLLDSMLPRQVLNINVENDLLTDLVLDRIQKETPVFGMLGLARLITARSYTTFVL